MKYFNYDNFSKRYGRLERAYFRTIDPARRAAILAARMELKRIWQIAYLKGQDK